MRHRVREGFELLVDCSHFAVPLLEIDGQLRPRLGELSRFCFPLDDYRCLLSDESRLFGQLDEHGHFRSKDIGVERLEQVVHRADAVAPYHLKDHWAQSVASGLAADRYHQAVEP